MTLRFSPRDNKADQIEWRPWSEETFAAAQASDRPVLLSISAVWCHWCHVMDETTFSDERVISLLNEAFVPIRVDNDRRPDINRRYNMGGWPTVAFLTPEGEVVTGATYVPPEQFVGVLERVQALWRDRRDDLRREVEAIRSRRSEDEGLRPERGESSEHVVGRVLEAIAASFDPGHGGFGAAMKFPRTDILLALVTDAETRPHREVSRRMLRETLDAMSAGEVWDGVEGGFFRYATQRDWSVPHFEKMLEDNAQLIRAFTAAGLVLDRPDYIRTAEEAQAYLDTHLWNAEDGLYGGSQDADEEYYALADEPARTAHGEPYVDPVTYTDWNAMEVVTLTALDAATGDDRYLERAVNMGRVLLARQSEGGLFRHDPLPDSLDGLLGDQVAVLEAFTALYQATGSKDWLDRAREIRRLIADRFTLGSGPLLGDVASVPRAEARTETDGPSTGSPVGRWGRFDRAEPPLPENSRYAACAATLARITRDEGLRQAAVDLLSALTPFVDGVGDFGAEIARALMVTLREPLHVTIVGREGAADTAALVDEAVAIPRVHKVVDVLDPETDQEQMDAVGYSGRRDGAQAYLCVEGTCLEPATTPEDLAELAASVIG